MKWKFWAHDTPPALHTTYIHTFDVCSIQFIEDAYRNSGKVLFRVRGDGWVSDRFTVEIDPHDKLVMFGTPDAPASAPAITHNELD